jgi:uncharacterized damage-inducible protein DinB
VPSDRATALAEDFAAANRDVVDFARSCTDVEWSLVVPGEQWSVGVVVHHIAEGHEHGLQWLSRMAQGQAVEDTAEGIDQDNAAHATRAAKADRDETVALLQANAAPLERALRSLRDEELDRTAPFGPAGGQELPTVALAAVAARHTREHLAHARAAVDEQR